MEIRTATTNDADVVWDIHLSAFPETESKAISKLAVDLLSEETDPLTLSLVAEAGGAAVGHVAFSPVTIQGTMDFLGYILAPLAVRPNYQKRGIGTGLVERGIVHLSETVSGILLVYGDPRYYGRFGFTVNFAESYNAPYPLQYPFGWQGLPLRNRRIRTTPVTIACVSPLTNSALW